MQTVDCLVLERPLVSEALTSLAKTLKNLRARADLSRRQLEDVSDVSAETIKLIEYGKNVRPELDTLRKLAKGLATNRALSRLDQAAADEMLTALMRAAGYLPASSDRAPEPVAPDIEAALRGMLADPEDAPLVADILRAWTRHDAATQRALLELVGPLIVRFPSASTQGT